MARNRQTEKKGERRRGKLNILTPPPPTSSPPDISMQLAFSEIQMAREKKTDEKKKETSGFGKGGWWWCVSMGGLLRKRPAIYVLVLCKYYMSSTFAQLFGITSTGWVYYFRNHALFMERHDLLPDTPLSLFLSLSGIFSLSPLLSFPLPLLLALSLSRALSFTLNLRNLNWLSLLNNYKAERPKWRCLQKTTCV